MASKYLKGVPLRHKVVIAGGGYRVEAALPDSFGVGVGADVSSPFAAFSAGGNAANLLATFSGATAKVGLFVAKIYLGPDQPDFSMDLRFEAYYSAYDEVVLPVGILMMMAAGTETVTNNQLDTFVNKAIDHITSSEVRKELSQITSFTSYLKSPSFLRVMFGEFLTVNKCLISSVTPSWGNVLDAAGNPMYCDVSITFTPAKPLTTSDIAQMFNQVKQFKRTT